MRIGIQGGPGSFNEEALIRRFEARQERAEAHEIVYLYRSERVLDALANGEVVQGQFAVHNSLGGAVSETATAKERCDFERNFVVTETFRLRISHCLMAKRGVALREIATLMTHPQVLAQCKRTLAVRFPTLTLVTGQGDLIDPARVGAAIASGELPPTIATLSSARIAQVYGLTVLADALEDEKENYTDFELVQRRAG